MKKLIYISGIVGLLAALIILVGFINRSQKNVKCSKIDIKINSNGNEDFVTKSDIEKIIEEMNSSIKEGNMKDADLNNIEKKISENPFIAKCDVYSTNDGVLKINVVQRKPLIRVMNIKGNSYYIDEDGLMMPLSTKYTPRIIIAHGNITNDYSPNYKLINFNKKVQIDTNKLTDLQKLFVLSKYVNKSDFWKAMIDQIYIDHNGDIELFLCVGNQAIILGGVDNLDEKFEKLFEFYKQKMNKIGWNKYKSINLKYKDQIVCSKK